MNQVAGVIFKAVVRSVNVITLKIYIILDTFKRGTKLENNFMGFIIEIAIIIHIFTSINGPL
jgi:hypothetical protein